MGGNQSKSQKVWNVSMGLLAVASAAAANFNSMYLPQSPDMAVSKVPRAAVGLPSDPAYFLDQNVVLERSYGTSFGNNPVQRLLEKNHWAPTVLKQGTCMGDTCGNVPRTVMQNFPDTRSYKVVEEYVPLTELIADFESQYLTGEKVSKHTFDHNEQYGKGRYGGFGMISIKQDFNQWEKQFKHYLFTIAKETGNKIDQSLVEFGFPIVNGKADTSRLLITSLPFYAVAKSDKFNLPRVANEGEGDIKLAGLDIKLPYLTEYRKFDKVGQYRNIFDYYKQKYFSANGYFFDNSLYRRPNFKWEGESINEGEIVEKWSEYLQNYDSINEVKKDHGYDYETWQGDDRMQDKISKIAGYSQQGKPSINLEDFHQYKR